MSLPLKTFKIATESGEVSHWAERVTAGRDQFQGGPEMSRVCRCGHDDAGHEHWRPGTDCGLCDCQKFTRQATAVRTVRMALRSRMHLPHLHTHHTR